MLDATTGGTHSSECLLVAHKITAKIITEVQEAGHVNCIRSVMSDLYSDRMKHDKNALHMLEGRLVPNRK